MKKYWIFVVNDNTWPEHLKAGVAAINIPPEEKQRQAAIAEIIGIKPGDYIFFNLRVSDLHPPQLLGLYEATSHPYYDTSPLFPQAQFVKENLPYRVGFKQLINFEKPLNISEIWYLKERGLIWTLQQTRGDAVGVHACISLAKQEGELITKLLEAVNLKRKPPTNIFPQVPTQPNPLPINLTVDVDGNLHYEDALKALIIKSLKNERLKEIFGDYDDFIPNVPTGARMEIDILLLKYANNEIIWYEILEIKAKTFSYKHLQRLIDYEKWFIKTRALTPIQIHPIAIAYDFDDKVKEYAKKRESYGEEPIKLVKYNFNSSTQELTFSEIS
jgi:predicted RNA-binding protein